MELDIIQKYEELKNGRKVAEALGLSVSKVYYVLHKYGVKLQPKTTIDTQDLIDLYNQGLSTQAIAKKMYITQSSVYERLKRAKIKLRSRRDALELCGHIKITKASEQEIIDMYHSGMSSMEIASVFGLKAKDGVLRVLKKHNIDRRDMYGSNNHAWKGGRLKLNKLIRNSATYIEFRDRIMRERDYTCEITGEHGGKLNVHHIKPFSQLIDEFVAIYGDDIDSDERREELYKAISEFEPFWQESNVVLVTEEYHKKLHKNDH